MVRYPSACNYDDLLPTGFTERVRFKLKLYDVTGMSSVLVDSYTGYIGSVIDTGNCN